MTAYKFCLDQKVDTITLQPEGPGQTGDAAPMAPHQYIPQFLLDRWAFRGRLCSYRWCPDAADVVENPRVLAGSAGVIDDLHAFYGLPSPPLDAPDRGLFARQIDGPAAHALAVMFAQGVPALRPGERKAWARLIVSFAARTPEALRAMGHSPATDYSDMLERALERALEPAKVAAVADMHWWLRRFEGRTMLLSDRPLLAQPRMPEPCAIAPGDPNCLIILPVAPDTVFFATPHPVIRAKARKTPKGKLASFINEETVWRAAEYVYAPDTSMSAFAYDRIVGKVKGGWRPK